MRMTGVVIKVRLNKGYAFIRGVDDGLSRFVHAREVNPPCAFDTLHEGQAVTFTPVGELNSDPDAANNGLRAEDVQCTT